jgi:hypothetical protein
MDAETRRKMRHAADEMERVACKIRMAAAADSEGFLPEEVEARAPVAMYGGALRVWRENVAVSGPAVAGTLHRPCSARPWLGQHVTPRPDAGWSDEEGGTVAPFVRWPGDDGYKLEDGWFALVNAKHPDGMMAHTQEFYPPNASGEGRP